MYYNLSIFIGAFSAIMIAINGILSKHFNSYMACVIIHLVGLVVIACIMLYKRESVAFWKYKSLPFWFYSGGFVGVATTIFQNLSFSLLSVSMIMALNLLGQSIGALVIDHFGCFGMSRHAINKKKLIGIGFIVVGICFMIFM